LSDFTAYYLSHKVGLIDALIAACAVGRNATLCTCNVKHYRIIPGLSLEQPIAAESPHNPVGERTDKRAWLGRKGHWQQFNRNVMPRVLGWGSSWDDLLVGQSFTSPCRNG